ncbi:hypothetical protein HII31_05578 [Pseudocercospora fuligena]|uniref:Uncharacterized protein n=1 Tax=Pseudocercospora fuligena TaxID=685502 RepID=A0A8H6RLA4_9PEZI|nr:hypothetical protein HII31_05578 [Pseudocercospora fuligena]
MPLPTMINLNVWSAKDRQHRVKDLLIFLLAINSGYHTVSAQRQCIRVVLNQYLCEDESSCEIAPDKIVQGTDTCCSMQDPALLDKLIWVDPPQAFKAPKAPRKGSAQYFAIPYIVEWIASRGDSISVNKYGSRVFVVPWSMLMPELALSNLCDVFKPKEPNFGEIDQESTAARAPAYIKWYKGEDSYYI